MSAHTRNANGLLDGFTYAYDDSGRINWKAHLSAKWLRVKDDKKAELERKTGKPLAAIDLTAVDDWYLYVKLGGYNEVARLRGFDSLTQSVDYISEQKAVVTCTIHFIPNVEEPNGLTCAGVASGSIYNIKPDFAPFMETFAENRAFARAVRRALNINIVAEEELGKGLTMAQNAGPAESRTESTDEPASLKPYAVLDKRCRELKISFEKLKTAAKIIKDKLTSDPETWTDWKDIVNGDVWTLLGKVNEKAG